jgi:predicted nucleotidyltransferase
MNSHQAPSKSLLDSITERIVSAASPKRIILFGSAAEERMGRDSDIDLLVVMPDGTHRRNTAKAIYRRLSGMGFSKDIVVVTESDVESHKDNPSMVIHPAIKNGRELYHAA